jgi:hypothetical protein
MEKNTKVGRWYLAITKSNYGSGMSVTICDTNHTNDVWVRDYNPQGYQIVASYGVDTFIQHNGEKLIMQGDCPVWTIENEDLIDAQVWVYRNR